MLGCVVEEAKKFIKDTTGTDRELTPEQLSSCRRIRDVIWNFIKNKCLEPDYSTEIEVFDIDGGEN